MAQIYRESALVLGREQLADGVFSLRLQTERIAAECAPGQFVSVYCADSSRLLPRPISVCEADPEKAVGAVSKSPDFGLCAASRGRERRNSPDLKRERS